MAKIRHANIVDTTNDIVQTAKEKGVVHLRSNNTSWEGRKIEIENKELINFGTCGYLGLETDSKIKEESIKFTERFGTQYSISRAYVSSSTNEYLEELLSEMFDGSGTIVFSSTTLAHFAILPLVVGNGDVIIIDQQAHVSMQSASQLVGYKGTQIEMIRHNNLEMLERKLSALKNNKEKVWYILDGVYSMFGDVTPMQELNKLMKKYSNLYLYVDDAHGMSWTGKNGNGSVFNTFKSNERTVLISTMAKGFGSIGGIAIFPNKEMYNRVRIHGGPLAYSHPIAPAILGASIASAKIHLSDEIYQHQNELQKRVKYCNKLLSETNLPVLSNESTPINFIGVGQPNVGYYLNQRLIKEGFYVNLGLFPAVPVKNTGVRFTITNHVSLEDIKNFVDVLSHYYPKALYANERTLSQVNKAFKLQHNVQLGVESSSEVTNSNYYVSVYESINKIDDAEWNELAISNPICTWENLQLIENAFSGNEKEEENAQFFYLMVRDVRTGEALMSTFLSLSLLKDDLFADENKSSRIEVVRREDPLYLTSQTLLQGCTITEGNHLFYKKNTDFNIVLDELILKIEEIQSQYQVNTVILRDFEMGKSVEDTFHDKGFVKIDLPNSNEVDLKSLRLNGFLFELSKNSKRNFKRYIKRFEEHFSVEFKNSLNDSELELFYQLQSSLVDSNVAVNLFRYPKKLFNLLNDAEGWEFILLRDKETNELIAIGSAFVGDDVYQTVLLGLRQIEGKKVYHQMLYQAVLRGQELDCDKMNLGYSADEAKKDIGAKQKRKIAFVQSKDNFNFEVIESIQNSTYE